MQYYVVKTSWKSSRTRSGVYLSAISGALSDEAGVLPKEYPRSDVVRSF